MMQPADFTFDGFLWVLVRFVYQNQIRYCQWFFVDRTVVSYAFNSQLNSIQNICSKVSQ